MFEIAVLFAIGIMHYRISGIHKEAKRSNELLQEIAQDLWARTNRELGL